MSPEDRQALKDTKVSPDFKKLWADISYGFIAVLNRMQATSDKDW